jgi:anti-sigma B factor antagonist
VSGCQVVIEPMDEDGVRVAVEGELAGSSAYTLDSELRRVEATRPARLLLDLSALAFIDSAGLARLLAAHRRAQREGRRLIVVQGTGACWRSPPSTTSSSCSPTRAPRLPPPTLEGFRARADNLCVGGDADAGRSPRRLRERRHTTCASFVRSACGCGTPTASRIGPHARIAAVH